jgi:hypothetical protein
MEGGEVRSLGKGLLSQNEEDGDGRDRSFSQYIKKEVWD